MLNKLSGMTRKRRKRHASKIRRQTERIELSRLSTEE